MHCRRHISVLQVGFVIFVLGNVCASQTTFRVSNPKHQEWPQAEASRIYFAAVRDLTGEFNLPKLPLAVFTLVLGANENSVDMNTREVRLKKWDKYLYAEGVLRLSFDQMLSSESKMRLARRAVAESEATVDFHKTEMSQRQSPHPVP